MAFWPSRTDIRLRENAVRDIKTMIEQSAALPVLIEASLSLPPTMRSSALIAEISKKINLSVEQVRSLFNTLENTLTIKEDAGSYEKAIDRLRSGLPEDVSDQLAMKYKEIVPYLEKYNSDNPVSISFKAERLTYLRNKILHDIEIVTDARPIFDDAGKKIIEMIVTHELVLTTFADNEIRRKHVTVDNADIVSIRAACDRALLKSKSLKDIFDEKVHIEIVRDED